MPYVNQTNGKYRVKGINDDMDTCMHCGKSGLKKVVWLTQVDIDGSDMGEVFCVGVDCAKSLLKMRGGRDSIIIQLTNEYANDLVNRISALKFKFYNETDCMLMRDNSDHSLGVSLSNCGGTYIPRDIWKEYVNAVRNEGMAVKDISYLVKMRNARYPVCQEAYAEMGVKKLEAIAKELGA